MNFSYARSEIRSFVLAGSRPYIHRMGKSELNFGHTPTPEELYALERAARAARAAEVARLLRVAVAAVRNSLAGSHNNKDLRHA
jgi:hypothetical protein